MLLRRTAIPTFHKYHKLYSVDSATDEIMDDPWESFQMGSAVLEQPRLQRAVESQLYRSLVGCL